MKTLHKIQCLLLFAGLFAAGSQTNAQEEAKPEVLVTYRYFAKNNNFQYLLVQTKIKANNKIQPMPGVVLKLFLDEGVPENLIGKVRTNEKGEAKAVLPVALKALWDASATHKFLAVVEATSAEEETTTELDITKAKIVLDTVNDEGTRKVRAQVLAFENGEWVPAKDVELKMGICRLGGTIKIGEEESYTTDSLGYAEGEFLIDSLPAVDEKGNIVLVAKMEDNELYGNLSMEKTVPWGTYFTPKSNFNERSLWGTRDKTPLWLLFMAYSIMAGVWGVILYLVFGLIKIKRLGKHEAVRAKEPESAKELLID